MPKLVPCLHAEGQHDSRKHHQAILCHLNKILLADYFHLRRSSACYVLVHATGCYDRVVHDVIILILACYGLDICHARILFQVLQKARHSIKTGFGESSPMYGPEFPPLQGWGQGNGQAPTGFALLTSVLFAIMEDKGHAYQLVSSITK